MKHSSSILIVNILLFFALGLKAEECSGWSVSIKEQSFTLCQAESYTFSMIATNDTGAALTRCQYKWEIKKPSSSNYEQVAMAETLTYLFEEEGIYSIRAFAQPNDCSVFHESTPINVELYSAAIAGSISGSQTICYNSVPTKLKQVTPPKGSDGNFTYQWQTKADADWIDIEGAKDSTYQPGSLMKSTSYRLKYTGLCQTITSNEVNIAVRSRLIAPQITTKVPMLCFGDNVTLECISEASGGIDDTFTYQWQESIDGVSFSDIANATALTYKTPALYSERYYRLVATSKQGCGSVVSEISRVTIYPDLSITNHGTGPLCSKGEGEISVSVEGAGDTYLYQWQESIDGISFTDIPMANNASYVIDKKQGGKYYYRVLVAPTNGCSSKFSDIFEVIVYPALVAGTISHTDTICYNSQPIALSQTASPMGGDNDFTYQWQQRKDGAEIWDDIADATSTSYQPGNLTTTTSFRLVATSTCGSVISNEIEIYVLRDLIAPMISDSAETVCYGFAPNEIAVTSISVCDVHDSLVYQWQMNNGGNWEDIEGATELSYQPEAMTEAQQYRVVATSVRGCGQVVSNVRRVDVYDDLEIVTTGIEPLCYMSCGTIQVVATGAGGLYTYQWQDSTNGIWNNVEYGTAVTYTTPANEGGTYYYRCIVNPTIGCTPDTSSVITVQVYDSIFPGSIAPLGADSICYGTMPEPISLITPSSGGDGNFTYQWQQREDGIDVWSDIAGETSTDFVPAALFKSMAYRLVVSDVCGVRYTNIVRIFVRDEIQAAVLAEYPDTICYNTIPETIVASAVATGGIDDSFGYQWLVSEDGTTFTEIAGAVDTEYQPEALLKKTYYRLRATSEKGCGDILSNIVTVNVYDSLQISSDNSDTLCYMEPTVLSVKAIGGGEHFSYQWQEKTGEVWQDIAGAVSATYTTEPRSDGEYYFRCIVISNKCNNYSRISPIITVNVYKVLNPGTITGIDSTCYSYAPTEKLRVDMPASGADGRYTYQWQHKKNGVWQSIAGETETAYQPNALFEGTDYRLQVACRCDTLYTNNIFIRVNPLPEIQEIDGSNNVCYNQYETYSVERLNSGFTYEWLIERNAGEILTESIDTGSIDVLWKNPNCSDSVVLRVRNDITGCERDLKLGVSICNEKAPKRTLIVRKPNSDILVCREVGEVFYQWGYTEKATMEESIIDNSNHRYVLLPHTFDTTLYDYWLTLRPTENSPCYSRSYYAATNDESIFPSTAKISVAYAPNRIPIVVQNPEQEQVICSIHTISGKLIGRFELGNKPYIVTSLSFSLTTGMYIVRVVMGEHIESIKLIAQ